ncbi:MAG: JDVT-CTERM system glutamic-type intramembrane protease [Porticoccaceae bacterium]|nr:JDVT-CTERM system glutamic-type intramembrane protease [Porticoccaceae bacterium]MDG1473628.1 JDVT-CTERM system glutamic-type intramembrane protease [Porticoccaceae bacterium]
MREFYKDRVFALLFIAPIPVWISFYLAGNFIHTWDVHLLISVILLYPLLEELVFRGLLLPIIAKKTPQKRWLLSSANIITSLIFVAAHLASHSPMWAVATFFPSLIFGYIQERTNNLAAPFVLHASYNAGYFLIFG